MTRAKVRAGWAEDDRRLLSRGRPIMWLNVMFLIVACLCVALIVGWVMSRPRRWGVFGAEIPKSPEDKTGVDPIARGA